MRYLNRAEVVASAAELDPVEVVRHVVAMHAKGRTTLPDEAYLGWQTADGVTARSLALPGAVWGPEPALGTKVICSSLANPARGLPRAHGLIMLFDRETARPVALMEGAHLSALRTSAYTALSMVLLGPSEPEKVAVVGCGTLGDAHVRLIAGRAPGTEFVLFDHVDDRRDELLRALDEVGVPCCPAGSVREAVSGAGVIVTTTTTTEPYLEYGWLSPGALVAHVSLDDVLPEVVQRAGLVIVDDWPLVSGDGRRLLGRMYRAGELTGPADEAAREPVAGARRVDATLGDVLTGRHPGRTSEEQVVLSNPFGMGILDVQLAAAVLGVAQAAGRGTVLPE
jgi:ornithine cyclodeaminase/alanine dehydrogenase-like protein (mu-crystallin family)